MPIPERYAHWLQAPDEELDYRPQPDSTPVTLETLAEVVEATLPLHGATLESVEHWDAEAGQWVREEGG